MAKLRLDFLFNHRLHGLMSRRRQPAKFVEFGFKGIEYHVFNDLPEVVVDRVRKILKRPVFPPPARHGHKIPLGTVDHLQPSDNERVVERDAGEGLQLFLVLEADADFRDIHRYLLSKDDDGVCVMVK